MQLFKDTSADSVWKQAVTVLLTDNKIPEQESRTGNTKELLHAAFTIKDPTQRWVISRRPALNPAFALVEALWILNGRNDAATLNFFNSSLPKFAGGGDTYHGAYGYRLRHQFGLDQLDRAYHALLSNPDTRQGVLQIWDPRTDFPNDRGEPVAEDIPCNINSFLKIRNGKLEWLQVLRSNDIFLGVPYNFVQFTTLQEVVAGWLGIEVGSYVHVSDSLHIYSRDLAKEIVDPGVEAEINQESLRLPKEDSDEVLAALTRCVDEVVIGTYNNWIPKRFFENCNLPRAYEHILRVITAEAYRRSNKVDLAQEMMEACSNPSLSQAWNNWLWRCSS